MAFSRRPDSDLESHAAITRSTSSVEIALGIEECRHVKTDGTAPSKPSETNPSKARNRINERTAVTGCPHALGFETVRIQDSGEVTAGDSVF